MKSLLKCLTLKIKEFFVQIVSTKPIENRKIIFWSNDLSKYSCNPKYISDYLNKNYKEKDLKVIWVVKRDVKIPLEDQYKFQVIRVNDIRGLNLKFLYELHTSKVIITNSRMSEHICFRKRTEQQYIQTWHSSMRLKKVEKDIEENLSEQYIKNAKEDSQKCDYIISGNKFTSKLIKESFWYDGKILETGNPRMDIFFNEKKNIKENLKKTYNIPANNKILFYAPTFRNGNKLDAYDLDYSRIISDLREKTGHNWIFIYRLHPNVKGDLKFGKDAINATNYGDIQEYIVASDIIITDYSSVMFDAALMRKPCFLFALDLKRYLEQERELYFNIRNLPFSISENNEELVNNMLDFNQDKFNNKCEEFLLEIGNFEEGKACAKVSKKILDIIEEKYEA